MITLERPAYYDSNRYSEYNGLSTDDKATIKAYNADKFYEIDTGKTYRYNEASNEWIEQPDPTAAVDSGIPPITSETSGHFLSNDGNVTHWQTIGAENFVIQLTEHTAQDTYTADKTWVEIKAAYDAKQNIVVRVDSSEFQLMSAQFANNGNKAGFTFGYTEIQTGGQRVVTRAIQYSHDEDGDNWSGSDHEADLSGYLPLEGGIMNGALTLAGEPQEDNHASTKKYVDDRTLVVTFRHDQTAGLITQTTIQEITQAILAKRLVYATLNGDTYNVSASSAAEVSFSHVDAVNKQVTTISYNSVDGTWSKQTNNYLPTIGGTMTGNIDMGANAIINIQKIHVDGAAPIYIGSTVESGVTNAARLTGVAGGGAAFVKANKQSEYATVSVGDPTQDVDIPNKGYVDASLSDVVRKAKVTVSGNSSVNVPLSNGVYLLAVSDNGHGGLVCVSVYPDGVTISGLVNLNGWTCTRTTGENSVTLKNTVASDMDIYITSVGEGAYR